MTARIRVANAPCSWGVLEFEGLRAEPAGYEQVLDEIAASGYAGTELGDFGFMPTDPAKLREELHRRRLGLLGAFVPVALRSPDAHMPGTDRALVHAALLSEAAGTHCFLVLADENGTVPERVLNAGRIRPAHALGPRERAVMAEGAEHIADVVYAQTGIRTVLHHHGAGYLETPEEIEDLLSRTDPEVLGLCLDTGHYAFGGGDPVEAVRRYGERVWHVHFKDYDPAAMQGDYFEAVRQGVFCELGTGVVDFAAVLEELRRIEYEGWIVVEQDVLPGMGTPLQSARRNRAFLRGLGL